MNRTDPWPDMVHGINVDVTDRPGTVRAAEETLRRFGKVHILVNNAAVGTITGLADATFDDWHWATSVNIDASSMVSGRSSL
ncbi:SDR family NAD(P)-dependent oxidoreductase [Caballeronia sp. SEWSISQ10-4 2]|uniref:SDR family NAD(P)-dependent oxidoreductase n=1 Tax=Caballeronia sp. SEWSISQ10-4 2 TaxID=2937438 RepID=UPI00264E7051|nr:SDR family NAD(P)-dependent oxidoreductase [Caballeronia sp. SEWSISQ10-4 2]MDN7179382.1 SDR family NAD(P)-dependent oxidoreductase [Caballeronia sp. SEWSISQ10-4 2]